MTIFVIAESSSNKTKTCQLALHLRKTIQAFKSNALHCYTTSTYGAFHLLNFFHLPIIIHIIF